MRIASPLCATAPAMPLPSGMRISPIASRCSATFSTRSSPSTRNSEARSAFSNCASLRVKANRPRSSRLRKALLLASAVASRKRSDSSVMSCSSSRNAFSSSRSTISSTGCLLRLSASISIMWRLLAMTASVKLVRRPSSRCTMRSAMSRMRLSCVTSRIVVPCSLARNFMRSTTSRPDLRSSEAVGSSAITMSGSAASARAIATRCRWPPDNCSGRWSRRSPMPTALSISRARSRCFDFG